MPIEFRCRGCSRLLRTEDGTTGQTARCPDCEALTVIPEAGAPRAPSHGGGPQGASEPAWHVPPPPPPHGPAQAPFGADPYVSGEPNPYQAPTQYGTPAYGLHTPNDGRATASLVLGLLGLVLWCCPIVGMISCGVGLTLGVLSLNAANRGMAVAGIVLNSVGLLLSLMNGLIGAFLAIAG